MARSHEGHDDAVILLAAVVEGGEELEAMPAEDGDKVEHEFLGRQALRARPWLALDGDLDEVVQDVLLVAHDLSRAVQEGAHACNDLWRKAV